MADTKISDDPGITPVGGGELIPCVQSGANKVLTPDDLLDYFRIELLPVVDAVAAANSDLVAAQSNFYLRFTASGAKTLTILNDADEAMNSNFRIVGRVVGTGNLTIVSDDDAVINPPLDGTLVVPQNGTFTLVRVAADLWDMYGDSVPA